MEKIDFLALNEVLEEYLATNRNTIYVKNLYLYLEKATQLIQCQELDTTIPVQETYIDLLEGIDLITEYLEKLNPTLKNNFLTMFFNGEIEINYTDEDCYLEEKKKESWHNHHAHNKEKKEIGQIVYSHSIPVSTIDIDNKKTTYSLLTTFIHEFLHTTTVYDKRKNYISESQRAVSEFISIYFELDFINWLIQEKKYSKKLFLSAYFDRYNDTTNKKSLNSFINETALLYKKITEGVLDKDSFKTGRITTDKTHYYSVCRSLDKAISFKQEKEKMQENFQYLKTKKIQILNATKSAPYFLGAPLAYFLISSNQITAQQMLDFSSEINSLNLEQSLHKIGLSQEIIANLDYTKIMKHMHDEIIQITNQKTKCTKKVLTKE